MPSEEPQAEPPRSLRAEALAEALAGAGHVLAAWRGVVRGNREMVSSLEATLRAGTYWLPGRFAETDLGGESVLSAVNLFSIWNSALAVPDRPTGLRPEHVGADMKARAEAARAWRAHHVLLSVEAVAEIVTDRFAGERAAWLLVVAVEGAKAALKLKLLGARADALLAPQASPADEAGDEGELHDQFAAELLEARRLVAPSAALSVHAGAAIAESVPVPGGGGRSLLVGRWPRTPLADGDPKHNSEAAFFAQAHGDSTALANGGGGGDGARTRAHSRGALVAAPRARGNPASAAAEIAAQWMHRLSAADRPARMLLLGELLWALRPLVYIALISHLRGRGPGGRRSATGGRRKLWLPWLLSLAIDLAAAILSARGARERQRQRARLTCPADSQKADGPKADSQGGADSQGADSQNGNAHPAADPSGKSGRESRGTAGGLDPAAHPAQPLVWLGELRTVAGLGGGPDSSLPPEWSGELMRRRRLFALYLLREPALHALTAPPITWLGRRLERVPLLGSLAANAVDLVHACSERHFYTSGS